jgi:hypothetical protein
MWGRYGWTGNPDQPAMIRMSLPKIRQMCDAAGKYLVYNLIEYHRGLCAM